MFFISLHPKYFTRLSDLKSLSPSDSNLIVHSLHVAANILFYLVQNNYTSKAANVSNID